MERSENKKTEMIKNNDNGKKYAEEKIEKEKNVNFNEKGDLAVVLYDHIGITSNELTLHKDEYLIVINWDIGNGYAFGYKINDPQKKGKFPFPLVRKYFKNKGLFVFFQLYKFIFMIFKYVYIYKSNKLNKKIINI